ncbi:MAG: hypothetical protein ACLPTJ_11720 [Solirubrobacteraceae bacterium]
MTETTNKKPALATIVFAAAITFIDRTIAAHRRPSIRKERTLSVPLGLFNDPGFAFANSTQLFFYILAGVMSATFLVTPRGLPRGQTAAGPGRPPRRRGPPPLHAQKPIWGSTGHASMVEDIGGESGRSSTTATAVTGGLL